VSELNGIYPENCIDDRIKDEYQRISIYFEKMAEHEKSIVLPLVRNLAFMRVTLDDLQEIIIRDGVVERYQNGANQFGTKQSAALQSYNSLVKNYAAVIKSLLSYLPPAERKMLMPDNTVREKTPAEWEEERRRDEENQKRINEEIARAAEKQRQQWEKEGRLKHGNPSNRI